MLHITHPKDLIRLRRLALASQGLLQAQPYGCGLVGARAAIQHLGYVQVDSISVVERAHHHVLYSRVPKCKPTVLNQLLVAGDIFEYWSHAAAFLPISDFRFSLPYKHAIKSGQTHWYKNPDKKCMQELLVRIRAEGPLRSRDIEARKTKGSGWWDWKPAKKALEQLYMQGDLMVSDREGFQKTYDLTERVLPSGVNTQMPSIKTFAEHMLLQQLRCHGLVSLKGLTYQRRNTELRKTMKILVGEKLAEGYLEEVQIPSGEVFILEAGALERRLPRLNKRMHILSPFGNSVIQRERLKTLFQFDYQLECYIPESKRQYGYFCLPLLYGDTFIGRMDCKAHRKIHHLEIKSLYWEHHTVNETVLVTAFIKAITKFCQFQQCNSVSLVNVQPKKLSQVLRNTLRQIDI